MGDASKVVPIDKLSVVITLVLAFIVLHEEFTTKSVIGCILIGAGTLLMVLQHNFQFIHNGFGCCFCSSYKSLLPCVISQKQHVMLFLPPAFSSGPFMLR